jgi:seryl-tRNA synthetase
MTDTPETDELRDDIWASVYVEGQDFMQMLEHARTLERERDEAIKQRESSAADWSDHIKNADLRVSRMKRELTAVTEERDRLAEALQEMQYDRSDKAIRMANELLQSLTQP